MRDASRELLVADFERRLGCRLPEDYRQYLLAGPLPALTDHDESSANPFVEILESFHDFDAQEEFRRLTGPRKGLPEWFLPIGDAFGVEIGLGIAGEHYGRVYELPHDTDTGPRLLYESFQESLKALRAKAEKWETRVDHRRPDT